MIEDRIGVDIGFQRGECNSKLLPPFSFVWIALSTFLYSWIVSLLDRLCACRLFD